MQSLRPILIALAALGFVLAVVGALTHTAILDVAPEGFSRACSNLALLAIALGLGGQKAA